MGGRASLTTCSASHNEKSGVQTIALATDPRHHGVTVPKREVQSVEMLKAIARPALRGRAAERKTGAETMTAGVNQFTVEFPLDRLRLPQQHGAAARLARFAAPIFAFCR